jgi:hypothetical protein
MFEIKKWAHEADQTTMNFGGKPSTMDRKKVYSNEEFLYSMCVLCMIID